MRQIMVLASVVALSLFLVAPEPLASSTITIAGADAALQSGPGILMLLGAGLLGISRRRR
ncbi:MAG: hypothetical protein HYS69_04395 [candidate division NC10 bacterium]|nr:hypothetical protein [candidate division NC10 bacterium]